MFAFLVGNLTDSTPLIVKLSFLLFHLRKLIAHADDIQQNRGFVLVGSVQELRQIERKFADEAVELLLTGFFSVRVDDFQSGILSAPLND